MSVIGNCGSSITVTEHCSAFCVPTSSIVFLAMAEQSCCWYLHIQHCLPDEPDLHWNVGIIDEFYVVKQFLNSVQIHHNWHRSNGRSPVSTCSVHETDRNTPGWRNGLTLFYDHCFSDIPSIEAQPCSSSHPNMKVTLMKQIPQSTKISGKENLG